MNNRIALLVYLDTAMLLLVCVLETIKLTGVEWHEWLGFALCPLTLLHVLLQWPWFATQFRNMGKCGAYRVRVSALLNLILFVLMAAVLFSGVFASRQSAVVIAESLGRVRIWREVHGWLNFVLVVFVGLHLALNWDWVLAALRRHPKRRPGNDDALLSRGRSPTLPLYLGRTLVLLLVASLAAGTAYFAVKVTLSPAKRDDLQSQRAVPATADYSQKKQLAPASRGVGDVLDGLFGFVFCVAVVLLTAITGRYVLRLRL